MKKETSNRFTPRVLSIILGLIGLAPPLFFIMLSLYYIQADRFVFLLFAVLCIFIVNYIIISNVLVNFIIKRIAPIYGKIGEIENLDEDNLKLDDKDMIGELDTKVVEWATKKMLENKKLRENDALRKEFIGNVAHELKTPIFNIQGYIDTLLDGGVYDNEINMKYLERTEKNVNRLIATIKDVDTISRLESGRVMLEYSDFDIVDMIFEIFELQDRLVKKYGVKLIYDGDEDDRIFIHADRDKVYEVMHNLIINSVKYGRKDGGVTRVRVEKQGEKIWIEVEDNGIGIPKQHLPHIFTRFYRVDKSRSRDRGGSGLGLSIVKHIIEAHEQNISVESERNVGTKFRLSFKAGNKY